MTEVIDLSKDLPLHPTKPVKQRKDVSRLVVHTTNWLISAQELAEYDIGPNHISKTGCPSITYHYLIGQDGKVTKTADHKAITWHVGNWNRGSLGVALVYKTDSSYEKSMIRTGTGSVEADNVPSPEMMNSLVWLLVQLCIEENVTPAKVFGHRELKGTGWFLNKKGSKRLRKTCPGMGVDLDALRTRVTLALQKELKALGLYSGDIDGDFGKNSKKALGEAACHSQLPI